VSADDHQRMARSPKAAALARLAIPVAVIGAFSALALIAISALAGRLQTLLWASLPDAFGADPEAAPWIIGVLTLTGLAVGLVVRYAPGHAGPDPATESLVSAPLPVAVVPGVALAAIVGLGGGVSLGPENPIIAINVALAVWLGHRIGRHVSTPQWVAFAVAGTVGAMFGTPVAAALLLTETPADPDGPTLWDRLFAPLIAAAAGSLTMDAFAEPVLSVDVAAYPGAAWLDLVMAPAIAVIAAVLGLALVYAFPTVHATFSRVRNPLVALLVGGLLLGVIGAIGGEVTLFKGVDEMKELVDAGKPAGQLAVILTVKLAALLIAASCGFRGGRIFPTVFAGVTLGLLVSQVDSSVPVSLAIGAGVLGLLLAVSRSGWLSLFMAVTTVGQIELLPVLCVALLPAWLLVTDRPQMLIGDRSAESPRRDESRSSTSA
jgi:H+/Cl- antiporter ClcA